MGRCCGL